MTGLNSRQNKPTYKQIRKSEVFIKSTQNTNFHQTGYWKYQSQLKNKSMHHNNSRWSGQYRDHTRLTQFSNFVPYNVNYSERGQHTSFYRLIKGTSFHQNKKFEKKNFHDITLK